jgi:uncharacterized protein YbaR (Trm112 family)
LTEELDKEEKTATIITKMAKTDYPIRDDIKKMECISIFH